MVRSQGPTKCLYDHIICWSALKPPSSSKRNVDNHCVCSAALQGKWEMKNTLWFIPQTVSLEILQLFRCGLNEVSELHWTKRNSADTLIYSGVIPFHGFSMYGKLYYAVLFDVNCKGKDITKYDCVVICGCFLSGTFVFSLQRASQTVQRLPGNVQPLLF